MVGRMDHVSTKLLGGVANGRTVPDDWEGVSVWRVPGTDLKSTYEVRQYFHGQDCIGVWVAFDVPEPDFRAIMAWHLEMQRGSLAVATRELMKEQGAAAVSYTNVILVVGYAGLFAMWQALSSGKDWELTAATSMFAAIFLAISAAAFVGWELFAMVLRGKAALALARGSSEPERFLEHFQAHQRAMDRISGALGKVWAYVTGTAIVTAVVAFSIMLSAMLHGAWLAL